MMNISASFSSPVNKSKRITSGNKSDLSSVENSAETTMSDLFTFDQKKEKKAINKRQILSSDEEETLSQLDSEEEECSEAESESTDDQKVAKETDEEGEEQSDENEGESKATDDAVEESESHVDAEELSFGSDSEETKEKQTVKNSIEEISIMHGAQQQIDDDIEIIEDSVEEIEDKHLVIVEEESTVHTFASQSTKELPHMPEKENSPPQPQQISVQNNARLPQLIDPPKVDPMLKPVQLPPKHGRLFGGQMTDERYQKINFISNDMIVAMHESLSTIPENIPTESPKGLKIELMPHQKVGLTWLLWRERQIPPSGILADDMGLGKTLSMISLILHKKKMRKTDAEFEENENRLRRHYITDKNLVPTNATLVIAPASLIYQWQKEINDRVKDDQLKVYIFHGPKNKRDIAAHRLGKFDVVITTYDLLASEIKRGVRLIGESDDDEEDDDDDMLMGGTSKRKPKLPKHSDSVLTKLAWDRIILDEAHEIRNKNSQKSRACCRLEAVHRWCLTGTPIHNKLWDLYSLVRFMRITPFAEEKMWKDFIEVASKKSADRLNTIVKSILLRRTKQQICAITNKPIVELSPKTYELVNLDLNGWEKHCYSIMFEASKQKVRDLLHEADFGYVRRKKGAEQVKNPFIGGNKMRAADNFQVYSCILVLLLRLRQACVHMSLTREAVDMDAFKEDGPDEDDKQKTAQALAQNLLETSFAQMSLEGDGLNSDDVLGKNNEEIEKVFEKEYPSAKVAAVCDRLDKIIEAGDKCVIVSQWTSMLSIVEHHIKKKGIRYTAITGAVKPDDRQQRVDSFNKVNNPVSVMLLSLTAGGVGLNLIGGNHLFMVDLHWNPALEQQACDRIYRLGQKKSVFIHKFVCNQTIEQRVLHIQEKKKTMATSVLEGAASKKLTKLTRDELKFLFELDRPGAPVQQQQPSTSTAA